MQLCVPAAGGEERIRTFRVWGVDLGETAPSAACACPPYMPCGISPGTISGEPLLMGCGLSKGAGPMNKSPPGRTDRNRTDALCVLRSMISSRETRFAAIYCAIHPPHCLTTKLLSHIAGCYPGCRLSGCLNREEEILSAPCSRWRAGPDSNRLPPGVLPGVLPQAPPAHIPRHKDGAAVHKRFRFCILFL